MRMEITKLILWILIAQKMVKRYKSNVLNHFIRKDELNGFNCNQTDFAFIPSNRTAKSGCAVRCTVVESCVSIFYDPSTSQCFGCNLTYGVDELTETLPGSLYYQEISTTFNLTTTTFGTSSYYSGPIGLTFEEALTYCNAKSTYVVQAETQKENEHLKTFFKTQPFTGYEIWHGMTDFETKGVWKWNSTGEPLTVFDDWGRNALNNNYTQNKCGKFAEARDRKWAPDNCTNNITITICEGSSV